MAIKETLSFAPKRRTMAAASRSTEERPASQFWLNFGYYAEDILEGEEKPRFISINAGVALDDIQELRTNTSNVVTNSFNQSRNDLYEQIMELAQELEPGQEATLALTIQVRRVNEVAEPIKPEENIFARPKQSGALLLKSVA